MHIGVEEASLWNFTFRFCMACLHVVCYGSCIKYYASCISLSIFRITVYRAELVFSIVPVSVSDAILNNNIGLISVFYQILHIFYYL